jgi:hypothetical protein
MALARGIDKPNAGDERRRARNLPPGRCDAVLRIAGASAGADEMVSTARLLGVRVFLDLSDIPDLTDRGEALQGDQVVPGAGGAGSE